MSEFENEPRLPLYEDDISNRERRSLKGPSKRERRNTVRTIQDASGITIRIERRVKNQLDFGPQRKLWYPSVQEGIATSKGVGSLALTVFDTKQQPLAFLAEDTTRESIEAKLRNGYPDLFRETPPIEITGVRLFGDEDENPFIGVFLAPGHAFDEKRRVRNIVAPELWLDDSHQLEDLPHVSLGQVFAPRQAKEIRDMLRPVMPRYVQFMPGTVSVEHRG